MGLGSDRWSGLALRAQELPLPPLCAALFPWSAGAQPLGAVFHGGDITFHAVGAQPQCSIPTLPSASPMLGCTQHFVSHSLSLQP